MLDGRGEDVPAAAFPGRRGPSPSRARLLLSVAPLVKITSSGRAPSTAATCPRAASTASLARWP